MACMGWGNSAVTAPVKKGEAHYLVVDGYLGAQPSFKLHLNCCTMQCDGVTCGKSDGCGGVCGCGEGQVCAAQTCTLPAKGNSCGDAWTIAELPFTHSGSTKDAYSDNFNMGVTCGADTPSGMGQPDLVYVFTPQAAGIYTIGLEAFIPGESPNLLTVSTGCGAGAGTCVASADFTDVKVVGGTTLNVAMEPNTSYFITLDSFQPEAVGPFTFTLSGPVPF